MYPALNIISEKPDSNFEFFLKLRPRPIPQNEALDFLVQIAMGLDHLHNDQHITHRDLNPANIMVFDDKTLKIGGFVVAKKHDLEPHSVSKIKYFNSFFAAPEVLSQAVREVLTPYFQDIYSLGLISCEMMAQELPQRVDIDNKSINFY